jgi:hypothetical protein
MNVSKLDAESTDGVQKFAREDPQALSRNSKAAIKE